ncbi:hypothetical protein [Nostoc sp.]|uniref:hypothetical protein n=1 Tax=Nostoc sp. TaxID=1180 RepID=UPI002FFC2A3E
MVKTVVLLVLILAHHKYRCLAREILGNSDGAYNKQYIQSHKPMAIAVVKPSSWLTTGIRVEKVKNIALLNHL